MFKKNVNVKDQFGVEYSILATVDQTNGAECSTNIKHITVDQEDIRPSFDMFFQSINSGKIFKII